MPTLISLPSTAKSERAAKALRSMSPSEVIEPVHSAETTGSSTSLTPATRGMETIPRRAEGSAATVTTW